LSVTPEDKPQAKQPKYPWQFTEQIKGKRILQRRGQISRHPEDKRRYNEVTTKLEDQIKRVKEETFQTKIQS
jgi:hypothetical protein